MIERMGVARAKPTPTEGYGCQRYIGWLVARSPPAELALVFCLIRPFAASTPAERHMPRRRNASFNAGTGLHMGLLEVADQCEPAMQHSPTPSLRLLSLSKRQAPLENNAPEARLSSN